MSTHNPPAPLGGRILSWPFILLALVFFSGLYVLGYRLIFGLGAASNLSNGYPMGIWVFFDLVIATGFACGGYALALVVYLLNRGEYHSLVRPALVGSVFGYSLGGLAAVIDMGRWWQGYNIFLPWHMNINSVMLELALCVALYSAVLWIEFSPALLERFKQTQKWVPRIKRVMFVFIALGILLPTMHQSSMGSMLIALGHKIAPLWQTNFLPLLFLMSAILMGFSMVIFEGTLSSLGFRRPSEAPLFARLSIFIVGLLIAYLVIRFGDLIWRYVTADPLMQAQFTATFNHPLRLLMFTIENALFIAPLIILLTPRLRANGHFLFFSGLSLLLAGTIYRINAFLVGFNPPPGYFYFPSVPEMILSMGMVAFEIMAFIFIIKFFPVMEKIDTSHASSHAPKMA